MILPGDFLPSNFAEGMLSAPLLTKRAHHSASMPIWGKVMGEVIPLRSSRAKADATLTAARADPLATILRVTDYWGLALTQIGRCYIDLPASSQQRLKIDLASLETKLRALKLVLDERNGKCSSAPAKNNAKATS
jgi:hypothetical protein